MTTHSKLPEDTTPEELAAAMFGKKVSEDVDLSDETIEGLLADAGIDLPDEE